MKEDSEQRNQLNEIRSQLYQIKILLVILIVLCLLGFYGISRSMWDDVASSVTGVCEVLLTVAFFTTPVVLIVWVRALGSLSRTIPTIGEGSESIGLEADSGKSKPASQQ